jgi:hypothetical protein
LSKNFLVNNLWISLKKKIHTEVWNSFPKIIITITDWIQTIIPN